MTHSLSLNLQTLPLELKINILINLPYSNVKFITSEYFWTKYWEKYNSIEHENELNPEQQHAINLIYEGKNVYVNAAAGTGKSVIAKKIPYIFNSKVVVTTATTGVAASQIDTFTLHSTLGIGIGDSPVDVLYNKIIKNHKKYTLWKSLDILIIDEISMLDPSLFEKLEKLARRIRKNDARFGGIQLLMLGDIFQLKSINSENLITLSSIFLSCVDEIIIFRNIYRQSDIKFQNVLNKIRVGIADDQVKDVLKSRFIKFNKISKDIIPTKLFCTKKLVNIYNDKKLDNLAKQNKHVFRNYDMKFIQTTDNIYFEYYKQTFIKQSTTPKTLQLCENAQVMLTRNISKKLVNGSRGIITGFDSKEYPIVKFLNGDIITISPQQFNIKSVGVAIQIPLKIAYALTIHSCQGLTLDCVYIDLNNAFEYGHVYTALSRVKHLEGLYLKEFNFDIITVNPNALYFLKMIL